MKQLYALGYEKRSIGEFVQLLLDSEIDVLVDVREKAWSHKPGFSKTAFSNALANAGIEYVHASFAGNPKRFREQARTHKAILDKYRKHLETNPTIVDEFDELVSGFLRKGRRVCLTCFERHPDDCHRSILATKWRGQRKVRVEHLAPTGCPRLIPV